MPHTRTPHTLLATLTLLWIAAAPTISAAQPLEIPAPLQPWVDWVMWDTPDPRCPKVGPEETRECVWPGSLHIEANDEGARFTLQAWLAAPAPLPIPGDSSRWPQAVQVDGRLASVHSQEGRPFITLPRGPHTITGQFSWSGLPEMMPIPRETGQVSLRLNGAPVERPNLDDQGRLWLSDTTGEDHSTGDLRVSIYRKITDDVPLHVTTEIHLNVSGKARKVDLGELFLPGSRPLRIDAELPVQLDPEGNLTAYIRPGTHKIELQATFDDDAQELIAPSQTLDIFDPQEVWIWVPQENIRSTELTGLPSVDPARTTLPKAWHGRSTYLAEPGQTLHLQTIRRGEAPSPDTIHLERQIWLDIDGRGMSIRDSLTGAITGERRLNYGGAAVLGRVEQAGAKEGLLITLDPETKERGVELRQADLNLTADLRFDEATRTLPATGWRQDVQSLSTRLYLPPGWALFGASGVDKIPGSWLSTWTLWHFFFVLMIAMSVGKLLGWRWAPLAALALILSHGFEHVPIWTLLAIIAAQALLKVLPRGWWRTLTVLLRFFIFLTIFISLANFSTQQIKAALYPQVDRQAGGVVRTDSFVSFPSAHRAEPMSSMESLEIAGDRLASSLATPGAPRATYGSLDLKSVDPQAVVQTGPGLPDWRWNQWELSWSGPVHQDHQLRLWLIPPWLNSILAILRVLTLIALVLLLLIAPNTARSATPTKKIDQPPWWRPLLTAGLLITTLSALSFLPTPAQAEPLEDKIPAQNTLQELRRRIEEADKCQGPCVVASHMDITVDDESFTAHVELHAQQEGAWTLPGPAEALQVQSVLINGRATQELRRDPQGMTLIRVPQGRHQVQLQATLLARDVITVQLDPLQRPKFVTFQAPQWSLDGVNSQGLPGNSIQLTRQERPDDDDQTPGDSRPAAPPQALAPWYQVHRQLAIGLPWQVITTVSRSDSARQQLLSLPLIAGEKVVSDDLEADQDRVLLNFERAVERVTYLSELPIKPDIELTAPTDQPWSEIWTVHCTPIWHCDYSDLPPVALLGAPEQTDAQAAAQDDAQAAPLRAQPQWKPWPGESLTIKVNRPKAAEGRSATVDKVTYDLTPGRRLLEAELILKIRATQGGWQEITLPEGAELRRTSIGPDSPNLRLEEGKLNLPIRPGSADYIILWQQPWEQGFAEKIPPVHIGADAVNTEITLTLNQNRWLLWTRGPKWGPAILFWPYLATLIFIAMLLSLLRGLPLKAYEWVLLLLGFTQLPAFTLIPIVAWFVALRLRAARPFEGRWIFNLTQIAIPLLTLAAMATLYAAIHVNLLVHIDMQVAGANSSNHFLRWYLDRSSAALPSPTLYSLPLWVWRLLMLLWSLWLVSRLLKWIPWAWRAFSEGGLWRPSKKKKKKPSKPQNRTLPRQQEPPEEQDPPRE